MSESLVIRDGVGAIKNLQVSSGSNGYIANHTIVSTVQNAEVSKYHTGSHYWNNTDGLIVADYDKDRVGIVINNDTTDLENGKCYIMLGNNTFGGTEVKPDLYSFLLEPGGLYIADTSTAALKHSIFVPSSSYISNEESMRVLVTKIK